MVESSPSNLKVVGLITAAAVSNKYRVNDRNNVWMNFTAIGMTVVESLSHNLNVVGLSSVPAADTMRVKMGMPHCLDVVGLSPAAPQECKYEKLVVFYLFQVLSWMSSAI